MAVARYYDPKRNPEGAHFPGVPLRDLSEEEFKALPDWVQRDIDASGLYTKTKTEGASASTGEPRKEAAPAKEKEKEEAQK